MRTWRPRKGPSPSSHGPGEEGNKPWYRVRLAGRRASSGTPEKLHSLQGAKLHAGQPGRTKPFQAMLREGRLPQEPPWTCTRACWRASLARCNHTACTFSQAAHPDKLHAGQGKERQKRGPCRPLHVVRPLQWETHGPPSPQRTHPVLPAPRFRNNHNPRGREVFPGGFVCVPRRQGPSETEWSYGLKTT